SFFLFQAEDGIRDFHVTGVQTCALPIYASDPRSAPASPDLPQSRRWRQRPRDRIADPCCPPAPASAPGSADRSPPGRSPAIRAEIGSASCRERVSVSVAGSIEKIRDEEG